MKTRWATGWITVVAGLVVAMMTIARPAAAADPLVNVDWVKANLGKPGIVFIDFAPPADFLRGHIPGAVNSNYAKDGWREERASDKVPDMLPAKLEPLGEMIGKLGIDNATHVVLVPAGMSSTDMGVGTRVYWTFKVLGHDNVSLLDGGMAAWTKDKKNPLQTGAAKIEPKTFKIAVRKDMIVTMDDVKKAKAAGVLLVDNRPEDQFAGINRHPKATESGTIEGAKNLPNGWLTVNGGGEFRNKSQLDQLYKVASVPTSGDQINFCNTGHWASVGWFVSSELIGNKKAKMYDGSMVEWTMLKGGPVEQRVKLQ
ncbi:MAG: sulfurtransferase [Burkholderiales bacterium]|nr:sulfurtransferase [Burkholderiales bacterium]MCE7877594.1 sulfurtransferase [Betaproteobacteria bacterium PRO3]